MFTVKNHETVIATFADKADAEAFARWKKESLAKEFHQTITEEYLLTHPETLPADIPTKEIYPRFKAYKDKLEKIITIE